MSTFVRGAKCDFYLIPIFEVSGKMISTNTSVSLNFDIVPLKTLSEVTLFSILLIKLAFDVLWKINFFRKIYLREIFSRVSIWKVSYTLIIFLWHSLIRYQFTRFIQIPSLKLLKLQISVLKFTEYLFSLSLATLTPFTPISRQWLAQS